MSLFCPSKTGAVHLALGEVETEGRKVAVPPVPSEIAAGSHLDRLRDVGAGRVWERGRTVYFGRVVPLVPNPFDVGAEPDPERILILEERRVLRSSARSAYSSGVG